MRPIPPDEYYQLPPAPGYPYFPQEEEKEVHLRDYWRVIWKRRWMIIAVFLIAVIFTIIKGLAVKPLYRGTTTIQINIENPQIVDFKEIFTVNMWAMDYYQTQYKILESRNLARRAVQRLSLTQHPDFLPQPLSPYQKFKSDILSSVFGFLRSLNPFSSSSKSSSSSQSLPIDNEDSVNDKAAPFVSGFLSRLKIEPVRESRLVRIHFDSYYPELAGQAPNVLAEEYIQMNLDFRVQSTVQQRHFYQCLQKAKLKK